MDRLRVPILTYHTLDGTPSVISISPAAFEWQMTWLHAQGYHVVPLSHLVKHLRGEGPLPSRTVVITFDDGFATVYRTAFPVLVRFRFPATVFVVSDYCGKVNDWPGQPWAVPRQALLTWAQVREMDRYGIEFGAHTVTHPRLDCLPPDAMEREIMDSKYAIEDRLGHPVDLFAYPYGRWSPASKIVVGRAFAGACTTHLALVGPRSDPLVLSRVDAAYVTRRFVFARFPDPWFSCYLDVRRAMRTASAHLLRRPWQ